MSNCGGAIRDREAIVELISSIDSHIKHFNEEVKYSKPTALKHVFRLRDTLLTQKCYLESMLNYASEKGKSRGSALYTDYTGIKPYASLPNTFTFSLDDGAKDSLIQEMLYKDGKCSFNWRPVRPLPKNDDFFENVWRSYRENGNIN